MDEKVVAGAAWSEETAAAGGADGARDLMVEHLFARMAESFAGQVPLQAQEVHAAVLAEAAENPVGAGITAATRLGLLPNPLRLCAVDEECGHLLRLAGDAITRLCDEALGCYEQAYDGLGRPMPMGERMLRASRCILMASWAALPLARILDGDGAPTHAPGVSLAAVEAAYGHIGKLEALEVRDALVALLDELDDAIGAELNSMREHAIAHAPSMAFPCGSDGCEEGGDDVEG